MVPFWSILNSYMYQNFKYIFGLNYTYRLNVNAIPFQTDVLVNSVGRDLDLTRGAVSIYMLQEGGNEIMSDCRRQHPTGVDYGEIVQTTPGKLQCKAIYHFSVPPWTKNANFSLQVKSINNKYKQFHVQF